MLGHNIIGITYQKTQNEPTNSNQVTLKACVGNYGTIFHIFLQTYFTPKKTLSSGDGQSTQPTANNRFSCIFNAPAI